MAAKLNASTRKTTTNAPARTGPAPAGDNFGEEAERVQLISIVAQLSAAEDAIEEAKAPLKAAQAARKKIVGLGKAAGFSAKELEKRLDEMKMGTRDMAQLEARERKQRRWLGILDADQADLLTGHSAPQEKKDEAHWQGEGYKAGLRGIRGTLPPGIPPRMDQPYLQGNEKGYADYLAALEANMPKKLEVRDQAAKDFEEDNPEVDIKKAARALKNNAAFMDRTAPPEEPEGQEAEAQQPVGEVV